MSDTTNDTKPKTEDLMGSKDPKAPNDLMGYEGQIDQSQIETAPETSLPDTSNADDVQTIINKAVKEVTVDEKTGKYIYPEGMNPMLKSAVAATKSYRDNQSGFTKSQQSLKETEAENKALREQLATKTSKSLELSNEDQTALDKLRDTDPDAWRAKLNRLESEAKTAVDEELETVTEEARTKASGEFELDRRYKYLDTFNSNRVNNKDSEGNLLTPITEDILNNDIPARITNKLAKNEITFEGYLDEVSEYLNAGKTVTKPGIEKTTDLNKANGTTIPSKDDTNEQGELDYSMQTL